MGLFSPQLTARRRSGVPPRSLSAELPNLAKKQVWYVGDAPSDSIASKQVGIAVVGAAWAATANVRELQALQPDRLFTLINEFTEWARNAGR